MKMRTCKKCGNKSILVDSGSGLCVKCSEESFKAEVEIQAHSLQYLAASVVPDLSFSILGLAYWNDTKTSVESGFGKLILSAIFSSIFMGMPGEHRLGVLGVSDKKLFVIDLGKVSGEFITPENLKTALVRSRLGGEISSSKSASFDSITVSCKPEKGVLSINGAIKIKATFPESYGTSNLSKAHEIAEAIQTTQK